MFFSGDFFVQKKESPVIEFFPQRWFYLGLLISGTTLLACLGYLGYDFFRRRAKRKSKVGERESPKSKVESRK